jgi:double-strand break repair protein MRE11
VDTTGVAEMSNPIRFGQDFQGKIANPRDVLVFHRSKKISKNTKITIDEPELSIDEPGLTVPERLAKVRVETLVKEYLSAQELQLLGELGMSDAIQLFVEKDDIHAIQKYPLFLSPSHSETESVISHVGKVLKAMTKGVRTNGRLDDRHLDEEGLDEIVQHCVSLISEWRS